MSVAFSRERGRELACGVLARGVLACGVVCLAALCWRCAGVGRTAGKIAGWGGVPAAGDTAP